MSGRLTIYNPLGVLAYRINGKRTALSGGSGITPPTDWNLDNLLYVLNKPIRLDNGTDEAGGFLFVFDSPGKMHPVTIEVRDQGVLDTIPELIINIVTTEGVTNADITAISANVTSINGANFYGKTYPIAVNQTKVITQDYDGSKTTIRLHSIHKAQAIALEFASDVTASLAA